MYCSPVHNEQTQSASLGDWGEEATEEQHLNGGLGFTAPQKGEAPPPQVPSEVPRQTPLSLLSPPCRVVSSPGSCPRPWSCPSLPRTLLSSLPSCSLTPSPLASSPISNLSSCSLSGHCFGIGRDCNLIG